MEREREGWEKARAEWAQARALLEEDRDIALGKVTNLQETFCARKKEILELFAKAADKERQLRAIRKSAREAENKAFEDYSTSVRNVKSKHVDSITGPIRN
jgi:hypothetical protein